MDLTLRRPGSPSTAPLRIGAAILALLVLAVIVAGAVLSVGYNGRILPGVRAVGVPVGGLDAATARDRLAEQAASLAAVQAELRAGDVRWSPTLAELGVALDPAQLTRDAYAVGRLRGPIDRMLVVAQAPFQPLDLTPVAVPPASVAAWVDRAASEFDRPAADARLEIAADGRVLLTPEQPGRQLDRQAATDQVVVALDGWLAALSTPGQPPLQLTLPQRAVEPTLTAASAAPTEREAERVLGRPVTLGVDEYRRTLDRPALASLLTVQRDGATVKLAVDDARLGALVADLAASSDRPPRDARLTITPEGAVEYNPDQPGRRLDRAAAAEQLRGAILAAEPAGRALALPAEQIPARLRERDLAPLRAAAEALLGGPVDLSAGDQSFAFSPREIAPLLGVTPAAIGSGKLEVDRARVEAGLGVIASRIERAPHNARLRIVADGLEPIEEGVDGQRLDLAAAVPAVVQALAQGRRQIALPVQALPAIKAADRAAFGPLELIETASTSYAGSVPERAHNVELAASRLDGFVVPPGQTFSFNAALGPTTVDNGFQWAWGIDGGGVGGAPRTVPSVGGGICQVATTLFHSVFWAGYQIEQRSWHLYWIPKYGLPPRGLQGLDATVDYESGTDLKWVNNTDSPVLIQARTGGAQISFSLYGKKAGWQVDVAPPQISALRPAGGSVTELSPALPAGQSLWVEEARPGFTSRIVRTVTAPGAEPRVLDMTSTYQPSRNVLLIGTGR